MPHVNEFRATPDHAGHDRLLVAALAAGDLAGADRDHALDLTRTCATCAELHDDLIALARATAAVPAPHPRPRDFQLTPADAARFRPTGWRRLVGGFAGARGAATRPLGVGLATIGLAGLLIGNAPAFSLGSSASAPTSAGVPSTGAAEDTAAGAQPAAASAAAPNLVSVPAPSAAASMAAGGALGTTEGPSPSAIAAPPTTEYDASSIPGRTAVGAGAGGAQSTGSTTAAGGPKAAESQPAARDLLTTAPAADANPLRPLNLVFALAVLAGLALLVASRVRSRTEA